MGGAGGWVWTVRVGLSRVRSIQAVGFSFLGVCVVGTAGVCSLVWCGGVGWCCDGWVLLLGVVYHGYGAFFGVFWGFSDWVGCTVRGDGVRALMSELSIAGDELNGVVASAL